ncbi:uncharacterized protein [Rutidosis leptorrhynchoides]|uniref:uncharacterized protein n=1 Tax=Rutidosis leptorrhynchoides TaxID=125765 RepID=UPI003A999C0D
MCERKRYELVEALRKRKVEFCVSKRLDGRVKGRLRSSTTSCGSRDRELVIQEVTYTVISAYAPHVGLGEAEKRHFWESLDEVVRMCPTDHRLLIGGDLNGHIGTDVEVYAGTHGGFGYGVRNEEELSILEFAVAHNLVVANSFFKKTAAHLATFHSGG